MRQSDAYRLLSGPVTIGMQVRVKLNGEWAGPRNGGIVRAVEDEFVFVEPDYPDVDEDGMFSMWRCTRSQLLVRENKRARP